MKRGKLFRVKSLKMLPASGKGKGRPDEKETF